MLYICNYADSRYLKQQELNTKSAYEKGKVDKVIEFHEEDIQELKLSYPEHFKILRGCGLWFWKPYLILRALEQLNDDDYLFYCDSGAVFINDIHLLIPDLEKSSKNIMFFEQPLLAKQFTKAETFYLLECNDYSGNQLLGGYIFLKKCSDSIRYMKEWLQAMSDIRVLSGEHFLPEVKEFKDFVCHREDQSVLTILAKKWGIEGDRDPSDFGIFPWQYMRAGKYRPKKYPNSHYPVILLCVRKNDPVEYEKNYYRALKLHRWGLNNAFTVRVKLMPMYCRHWGRLLLESIGLSSIHKWLKERKR